MYNYKLTIQYDGTRYRGWQVQGNTDQTIQGKVEGVLSRLTGQPVELHGSGRAGTIPRPTQRPFQNLPLPHLEQRNPQRAGAQLPLPPPRAAGCGCYGAGSGGFGGHPRFPQLLWPETVQKVHCPHHHGHHHHPTRFRSPPGVHRQRVFNAHGAHFGRDAGGSGAGTAGGGRHAGGAGRPRPCRRWACAACARSGVGVRGILIYTKRRFPEGNRLLFCLEEQ